MNNNIYYQAAKFYVWTYTTGGIDATECWRKSVKVEKTSKSNEISGQQFCGLRYFGFVGSAFNCTCMGRFDTSGTSKNDNFPKVLVGHGVKKYGIEIF